MYRLVEYITISRVDGVMETPVMLLITVFLRVKKLTNAFSFFFNFHFIIICVCVAAHEHRTYHNNNLQRAHARSQATTAGISMSMCQ